MSSVSFSTVPPIANGGGWGCIVRDLETIIVFVLLAYNSISGMKFIKVRGRVGRVTDCGVRGLWFKSLGSILTSRTETSSLSRVVSYDWDPCSVPVSG